MGIEDKYIGMGMGVGIAFFALSFPITGYLQSQKEIRMIELEKAKVEKGYVLQERDLNGNNIPEKFYEIDGNKSFLSIDGKIL